MVAAYSPIKTNSQNSVPPHLSFTELATTSDIRNAIPSSLNSMKLWVGASARLLAVSIISTLMLPHRIDENTVSAR